MSLSIVRLNQLYLFFTGILLLGSGTFIMQKNVSLLPMLTLAITGGLLIDSISHFFQFFIKKNQQRRSLLDALTGLGLAAIFHFSQIPFYLLAIVFGAYLILKGVALLVNYHTYRQNKLTGRFNLFISGFFQVVIGGVLLWSPRLAIGDILVIIGFYFALYGIANLFLTLQTFISEDTKNRLKRKIRLTPPVFIEAFVPRTVLKETNALLNPELSKTEKKEEIALSEKKSDAQPDLEIFIHVTEKSYGSIGHMDLCFDGEIISYGNYDEDSYRLFDTVGDGVLISTQKEAYIRFCIEHNQKTLFGFGIQLNPQQCLEIQQKIAELKSDCYSWKSHLEKANDAGASYTIQTNPFPDYASCLYAATHCQLFKFNHGKFKRYFVLTTNCVLLADTIIGPSGIDLLTINGILTPGAYLDFLNHEFKRENSNVVTYQVYN